VTSSKVGWIRFVNQTEHKFTQYSGKDTSWEDSCWKTEKIEVCA